MKRLLCIALSLSFSCVLFSSARNNPMEILLPSDLVYRGEEWKLHDLVYRGEAVEVFFLDDNPIAFPLK